jgi:hypothetical protein
LARREAMGDVVPHRFIRRGGPAGMTRRRISASSIETRRSGATPWTTMTSGVRCVMKLQRIDELTRPEHSFLAPDDDCFFLREYTAGAGQEHGETNNLIMSLLLIHAICRTHSTHPVQSAEADPGAGNKLLEEPRRRCWGQAREVAS